MRARHGARLPERGADAVTVPGGVRGWDALRRQGSRLSWQEVLLAAEEAAHDGVPVAPSLATHIEDPEHTELFGTDDFERVFRPNGRSLAEGEHFRQPALAQTFRILRQQGPDCFYEGELAHRAVEFLRSRGSVFVHDDFAEFTSEISDPVAVLFRGLTVLTSPPNSHGFILLRALRAIEELGLTDPLGDGFGTLMRIFHRANDLRALALADPRKAHIDVEELINADLHAVSELVGADEQPALVPHGDTVGIAAMDSDGYAVSLIQSVYGAFGSGVIDPETGILFHNRGTSFSLDDSSPNVLSPRKRPAHTLMPAMTTHDGAVRHVLSTMGGQGQPQIIAQLLLRMMAGANAEAALAAPRGIVGRQFDENTADSVSVETDLAAVARQSLARTALHVKQVSVHNESLGQSNAIVVTADRSMTAASDPRADGSATVVNYPRHRWQSIG